MLNKSASIAILLLVSVGVAFSTGYWSGTLVENSQANSDLDIRLRELESRLSEQLVVFTTSLEWDSVQFAIMNIGTTNVTISEIQINGLTNGSSPGWRVENGDNILLPGQRISITLNVLKYFSQGLTGDSESYKFAFVTSKGNMYYCVPMPTDLLYTRFEKIVIMSASAKKESNGNFTITIELKNTGSADVTIYQLLINGKSYSDYGTNNITTNAIDLLIVAGQAETVYISILDGTFESGATIEIKLHSAAGMDYPVMVTLP